MLGIGLGVAVVVAIQLTNASSLRGFETALNTVSGRASLEIIGTGVGVEEQQLTTLGWLRDYGDAAPVIEGDLILREEGRPTETLRLLGVDVLRDRSFRDYPLAQSPTLTAPYATPSAASSAASSAKASATASAMRSTETTTAPISKTYWALTGDPISGEPMT